jgi:hypothetical protein
MAFHRYLYLGQQTLACCNCDALTYEYAHGVANARAWQKLSHIENTEISSLSSPPVPGLRDCQCEPPSHIVDRREVM